MKFGTDTNLVGFIPYIFFVHPRFNSGLSVFFVTVHCVGRVFKLGQSALRCSAIVDEERLPFFSFKDIFYSYVHLHSLRLLRDGWCCARSGGFIFLEAVCLAFL